MRKIKLLFVIPSLVTGGAERVATHLIKYIRRNTFEIALCVFEKKGKLIDDVPPDVRIFDLQKKGKLGYPLLIKKLWEVINSYGPDIMLTFLWYTTSIGAFARVLLLGKYKPFLLAYEPQNSKTDIIEQNFTLLKRVMIDVSHSLTDLVLVDSYGAAGEIIQTHRMNQKKGSIKVIYNSVDVDAIEKAVKGSNPNSANLPGRPVIVSFGRLVARKGFDRLIRAFVLVRKVIPSKLVLIGEGVERENLEKLAKVLSVYEDVTFLGYQDNPYKIIANSSVFVFPSLREGFGNVVIEAMASGVPVVAFRCPFGPDEIISHNVNGILVPVDDVKALADAIVKLLRDKELRRRLAEAGRIRARDFDVKRIAREYEELFMGVVQKTRENPKCGDAQRTKK